MLNQILDRIGLSRAVNEDWYHDASQEIKEKYREITSEVFKHFGTADVWLLKHPLFKARILIGVVLKQEISNGKPDTSSYQNPEKDRQRRQRPTNRINPILAALSRTHRIHIRLNLPITPNTFWVIK